MKRLEASEQGFAQANRYYLLMWVLVSVVFVTAFVEHRSYRKEWTATEATIRSYTQLEDQSNAAASTLRSALYSLPGFENEEAALRALREPYGRLRGELPGMRAMIDERITTNPDMRAVVPRLNMLIALIHFNDPMLSQQQQQSPHISYLPFLAMAEHEIGSLRTAQSVEQLRVEDAARFIWLSSLGLPRWEQELAEIGAMIEAGESGRVIDARLIRLVLSVGNNSARAAAESLWNTWLRPAPGIEDGEVERRRRLNLTLDEPGRIILAAYQQRAELQARATGEASEVTLPIVSVPIRLGDAVIMLPATLVFCALAMLVYTDRGLRYAPETPSGTEVVGSIPVYYASYGVAPWFLAYLVGLLMLSAPLLVAAAVPLFLETAPAGFEFETLFPEVWNLILGTICHWRLYFSLLAAAVVLCGFVYTRSRRIRDLIDRDIAVKDLPRDEGVARRQPRTGGEAATDPPADEGAAPGQPLTGGKSVKRRPGGKGAAPGRPRAEDETVRKRPGVKGAAKGG